MTNFTVAAPRYTTSPPLNSTSHCSKLETMPSSLEQPNHDKYDGKPIYRLPLPLITSLISLASKVLRKTIDLPRIPMDQTSSSLNCHPMTTTFTKFGELPPELRLKVWEFALPEARTVVVNSPFTNAKLRLRSLDSGLPLAADEPTWWSTTQIPALLHVNNESRYEALKHYSLSFGVGNAQPRVYVDFKRDTIFFGDAELTPECSRLWSQTEDLDKVRRFAIVPEGAWRALRWKKIDLGLLEKLIFVHQCKDTKLGHLPQLVEDVPSDTEPTLDQRLQQLEMVMAESGLEIGSPKQRIQAAREEFDTLKMILPSQWDSEPIISTAVFRGTS